MDGRHHRAEVLNAPEWLCGPFDAPHHDGHCGIEETAGLGLFEGWSRRQVAEASVDSAGAE